MIYRFIVNTQGRNDFIDITSEIGRIVVQSKIKEIIKNWKEKKEKGLKEGKKERLLRFIVDGLYLAMDVIIILLVVLLVCWLGMLVNKIK